MRFFLFMVMTKVLIFFSFLMMGMFACAVTDYTPSKYLHGGDTDSIMRKLVRYLAKPPGNISGEDRFSARFDRYYEQKLATTTLEQFYLNDNEAYFLVSQPASAIGNKRNAVGGRLTFGRDGNVIVYEEIFRTWKMTPDILKARSYFLFDKMMAGESLKPYWTKNSNGVDFIELPDDRSYFDIGSRQWKSKIGY